MESYLRGGGAGRRRRRRGRATSFDDGEDEEDEDRRSGGGGGGGDPFGDMARDLSACEITRRSGGIVGWVDNPSYRRDDGSSSSDCGSSSGSPLPEDVVRSLFDLRPKGGDVRRVRSESDGRWYLIRVDDVAVSSSSSAADGRTTTNEIVRRKKLRGLGVVPTSPSFVPSDSSSSSPAKTYHVATAGCQMNVADSERLAGVLESDRLDLSRVDDPSKADVVVFNTCSVRDRAEQKLYDALGPVAARKRKGERVAAVVAGCVAQQEGRDLLRRVPELDLVMGPQYVNRLADLLEDVGNGHRIVATDPTLWTEDWTRPVRGGHKVRGWVNVIHGCNERCTYCVVPQTRGVEQSRSMEAVLDECLDLARGGYREVTLLGQNVDAYGRDMVPKRTFAELLRRVNDNLPPDTIERIRYVTSHPRYFSDRVIDAVANLDKVCECFHMPFQSGDDSVLKDMRRGYTSDSYLKIIDKIKRIAGDDAGITADVIVGFPGETDEAFRRTLDLMSTVKFDNLNSFAYSPRPGTEAASRSDQIPDDVKSERLKIVQRLAAEHAKERSGRYAGRTVPVLVEDRNPKDLDQVMGRTRQGRQVFFDGDVEESRGRTVDVLVTEGRTWSLMGERVAAAR